MPISFVKQFLINVALDKGKLTGDKIEKDISDAKAKEKPKESIFDQAKTSEPKKNSFWSGKKEPEADKK